MYHKFDNQEDLESFLSELELKTIHDGYQIVPQNEQDNDNGIGVLAEVTYENHLIVIFYENRMDNRYPDWRIRLKRTR